MPQGFVAADYDDVQALCRPGCYGWVCDGDAADVLPFLFPAGIGELRLVSGDRSHKTLEANSYSLVKDLILRYAHAKDVNSVWPLVRNLHQQQP